MKLTLPPPVRFRCSLGQDDLRFVSMNAVEGMSRLGQTDVVLVSSMANIDSAALLGKPACIEIQQRGGAFRYIHGIVVRFGHAQPKGRWFGYRLTLRPWLWMLSRTSDCRIFQEQTVPEIIEQVFADHPIAAFEFDLRRVYRKRTYCVQYRETDLNFVARLLEDEGIFWYFKHGQSEHRLVLSDEVSGLSSTEGSDALPYFTAQGAPPPGVQYILSWDGSREVLTGTASTTSYDFERPGLSLEVDARLHREHVQSSHEQFDFTGDFLEIQQGQQLAENRIAEQQCQYERCSGSTNSLNVAAGRLFSLSRHPRDDQNQSFVCLHAQSIIGVASHESDSEGEVAYECHFTAMPASETYRPPRNTPRAMVTGPQTAVVVGPAGEEIHTDKYGRVKVQFHWDRYGKKDEKSSCWVRVSSPWAGKNFGFVQVPRIGQEVVVDFLEGDPDQPIITGRVYNAQQMPPWELPANATQSGMLTRSSKGGAYGNANAIRFEDKQGAEQLWIHAEKNQDNEVENDETTDIGRDRSEHVGRHETVTIDGMHFETVKLAKTETIFLAKALSIGLGYQTTVGAAMNTSVALGQGEQVGLVKDVRVGTHYNITAGDSFSITVGKARLTMTKDGKVTLVGSQFLFDASGPVQINGKDIDLN